MSHRGRTALLLALSIVSCGSWVAAQEEVRPEEKPPYDLTPEEKAEREVAIPGHASSTVWDNEARTIEFMARYGLRPDLSPRGEDGLGGYFPPTTFMTFGPEGILIERSDPNQVLGTSRLVRSLTFPYFLSGNFKMGDLFVLRGDVSSKDEMLLRLYGYTVRVSNASPKQDDKEMESAGRLAVKAFEPDSSVVMNALPFETVRSREELARMGLMGTASHWRSARQEITAAAGKIPIRVATKEAILEELRNGYSDVLFVIAHSDSNAIFLPGIAGGKIAIKELDSIKRQSTPYRAIVLLACKAGGINGKTQSIAEALIKNHLASIVFASDDLIYTRDVAAMLKRLQGDTSLGQVLRNLRAIVRVDEPQAPWGLEKPMEGALILRRTEENL